MIVRIRESAVCVELPLAEARVFLDELAEVRGGSKLPKLRQVCDHLARTLELIADGKRHEKRSRIAKESIK